MKKPLIPIALIAPPGGKELAQLVDRELVKRRYNKSGEKSFIIPCECPRFANGEAKAVLYQSIRGCDVYIINDIGNYGCRFTIQGIETPMSPDDHFQDIKRVVAAIGGRANRVNVIMPLLYQSRQHKRTARESLDCALALQELQNLGVKNIITFDAHNSHVQNAVPLMGFENLHASYQIIRSLLENEKDIIVDKGHLTVVSPDEGAVDRCLYYANSLGIELGLFYKRRDTTKIVDGKNPIIKHEFLGANLTGKDVLIVDDMLASGQSMLMAARELKRLGAKDIYVVVTFALLADDGIRRFEEAYKCNIIKRVYATNLTYRHPKLKDAEWFREVDISEFIAYFIDQFNREESISALLDTSSKIHKFLKRR
ncbi:MAG: ribose-phosphate pyrophosphokinase [candidate division WOR-3 bacterium]|nr:ribose-phosphate pyrophosphokinase [candidate division WOR-3 bacterium]